MNRTKLHEFNIYCHTQKMWPIFAVREQENISMSCKYRCFTSRKLILLKQKKTRERPASVFTASMSSPQVGRIKDE